MSKICCFTGHRNVPEELTLAIYTELEAVLTELIEKEDVRDFRAGGAIGFDTIAALVVLKLKLKYPDIRLHLFLPCHDQDKRFNSFQKSLYGFAKDEADSVIYVQKHYSSTAMHKRNRALVDGSDFCVAFLRKSEGGTQYTVNYARRKGVPVIKLLDNK